jgi:predicted RNA-binding protein with PUA-like domain
MAYWLIKSEPFVYSWQQFLKDEKTGWEGVRNYLARNNLRSMQKGDQVFWYHSNEGLAIVGIARVSREAYPDPTHDGTTWSCVDLVPLRSLKQAVTLERIKKEPRLQQFALLRLSRVSVVPVTEDEWNIILEMSGGL